MNKIIFVVFLAVIIAIITVLILQGSDVIENKFSDDTMSVFNCISEISLYILVGILIINVLVSSFVQKYKNISADVTLMLVYILLGTTILSVNVVIWVWIVTVGITLVLLLFSISELIYSIKTCK